ncbi:MAG: hypothetical protein JWO20_2644 [Candidatus Angelobacter sp.]|nr:hypothetical protein [Candidatus Angelobacter sp.]
MARGFESKQVEEQQSAALASSSDSQKQALSPEEKKRMQQNASLELMRAKIVNDIAASTNERRRAMLEMALKDIEQKLQS